MVLLLILLALFSELNNARRGQSVGVQELDFVENHGQGLFHHEKHGQDASSVPSDRRRYPQMGVKVRNVYKKHIEDGLHQGDQNSDSAISLLTVDDTEPESEWANLLGSSPTRFPKSQAIVKRVSQRANDAFTAVREGANNAFNAVREEARGALSTVKKGANNAFNAIRGGARRALSTVKNGAHAVASRFRRDDFRKRLETPVTLENDKAINLALSIFKIVNEDSEYLNTQGVYRVPPSKCDLNAILVAKEQELMNNDRGCLMSALKTIVLEKLIVFPISQDLLEQLEDLHINASLLLKKAIDESKETGDPLKVNPEIELPHDHVMNDMLNLIDDTTSMMIQEIMHHILVVSDHSDKNFMSFNNLCIIWGPNIVRHPENFVNYEIWVKNGKKINWVVQYFMRQYLFNHGILYVVTTELEQSPQYIKQVKKEKEQTELKTTGK